MVIKFVEGITVEGLDLVCQIGASKYKTYRKRICGDWEVPAQEVIPTSHCRLAVPGFQQQAYGIPEGLSRVHVPVGPSVRVLCCPGQSCGR
jgi:hypothetical protein